MPCDYKKLPHKGIQALTPYIPGKSIEEVAREQGVMNIIKLASNENPRGCSPQVLKALSTLSGLQIATYPAPSNSPLLLKLAEKHHVHEDMLTLSNGSDALFQLLLICFALGSDKHIITHEYAFQAYAIQAKTLGIPLKITPLLNNWHVDIEAIITTCTQNTALIFLANPNNPTGTLLSEAEIKHLLTHIPETTLLVLDEAYNEYLSPAEKVDTISLLTDYPNLVITRTFSKSYGLAGLRLGYAISNPTIHELLQKVILPFTINQAALTAGEAALDDEAFVRDSVTLNRQELKRIRETMTKLHFTCLPSPANYITFDCKVDGKIIYEALLKHGIIVRPLHPYGLNNYLRVSTGTTEQTTYFIEKLLTISG